MTTNSSESAAAKEAAAKKRQEELAAERRRRIEEEQKKKREADQAQRAMHKLVEHAGMASTTARRHFQTVHNGIANVDHINGKQTDSLVRHIAGDIFPGLAFDLSGHNHNDAAASTRNGDSGNKQKQPQGLSQEALTADAHKLHTALNDKHSATEAQQILGTMTVSDKNALKQIYHQQFDPHGAANTLRNDLEKNLGKTDAYKLEDTLDKQDNVTNYGGDLRVLMHETTGDNSSGANANLVDYLSTLNSKQLAQASQQYKQFYGQTLQQALNKTYGDALSDTTKAALPYLLKGSDQRSAADNVALARIAVKNGGEDGKRLLGIAVADSTPAGNEARQELQHDSQFLQRAHKQWSKGQDAQVVNDYLNEGHISLATIATGDTKNPKNLEHAIETATPQERLQYADGQAVALSGKAPVSSADQAALAYYKKLHGAFQQISKGNKAEVVQWEDKLVNGGNTLVSKLAADAKSPAKMAEAAQNLTQQDWERLRDPINGRAYREQIVATLREFANPEQQKQVLTLLNDKANSASWQDAQRVTQPFLQSVANDPSAENIVNSITQLNGKDLHKYQSDAAFRKQVDSVVDKQLSGVNQMLARRMLSQVEQTGKLPHLTATDNLLLDNLNHASSTKTLMDLQEAVKENPGVKKYAGECAVHESPVMSMLVETAYKNLGSSDGLKFLQTGTLTLQQQLDHGFPKTQIYENLAKAGVAEQKTVLEHLTPQQRQVAENAIRQDGKLSLADQLRSFVLNDGTGFGTFAPALAQLNQQQKEQLFNEYNRKYGGDLSVDFLSKVPAANQRNMEDLLTASGASAQHDFAMESQPHNGKVEDASNLTADRATDNFRNQLTQFDSRFQDMPPQMAQQLNDALNQVQADYQQARKKYDADHPGFWDEVEHIGVQLAVTTVTIAAAAGASAVLGPEAGAGVIMASRLLASGLTYAVANGAATEAEGGAYDWSPGNLLKQAAIGSVYGISGATASQLAEGLVGKVAGEDASNALTRFLDRVAGDSVTAKTFAGKAGEKAVKAAFGGTAVTGVTVITSPITGRKLDLNTLESSFIAGAGASLAMPVFTRAGRALWDNVSNTEAWQNFSLAASNARVTLAADGGTAWDNLVNRIANKQLEAVAVDEAAQAAGINPDSLWQKIAHNTSVKGSIFGNLPHQQSAQTIWNEMHNVSPADQHNLEAKFQALNHIDVLQEVLKLARQFDSSNSGQGLRDLLSWAQNGTAHNPAEISQFITTFAATHPQLSLRDIKDAVLSGNLQ